MKTRTACHYMVKKIHRPFGLMSLKVSCFTLSTLSLLLFGASRKPATNIVLAKKEGLLRLIRPLIVVIPEERAGGPVALKPADCPRRGRRGGSFFCPFFFFKKQVGEISQWVFISTERWLKQHPPSPAVGL